MEMNQNNTNQQIQSVPTKPHEAVVNVPNGKKEKKDDKKKSETILIAILLVIVILFILLLPITYKFISGFSFGKIFGQSNDKTKTPNSEQVKGKDEYLARVCTIVDKNGVQSTHTLYFTNKKISKMQLIETYTLNEKNTVESLDKFYEDVKNKYNQNKNIDIATNSTKNNYVVTANIALKKNDTIAKELMTVKVDLNDSYENVMKKYSNKGFECDEGIGK